MRSNSNYNDIKTDKGIIIRKCSSGVTYLSDDYEERKKKENNIINTKFNINNKK